MAAAASRSLARPRWRDLLIWQAGEVFYFAMVWMYLGGFTASATIGRARTSPTACAIVVRVAAELYLVAVVVRDVLRPWHDPVRHLPDRRADGTRSYRDPWSRVRRVR